MRKNLFSVLAVIMSIALCSCGKSQAARSVDQMIKSIGEVTLESESLILEAEAAAEALAEEDRVQLDNLEMLASARETYDTLFEASEVDEAISKIGEVTLESSTAVTLARKKYDKCSDAVKSCVTKLAELETAEKAAEVDQAILDIGEVTLESKEAIAHARELYNGCSSDVKAMVTKLSNLTIAENEYKAAEVDQAICKIGEVTLESEDAIAYAREVYEGCTTAVKAYVTKLADLKEAEYKFEATKADQAISEIGVVTLESGELIAHAREVYDDCTDDVKACVTKLADLEAAEERLSELQKQQVQTLLSNMRLEDDKVRGYKFYYSKTQPYYADTRCYVLPYIGQSSSKTWLCARYHYTARDWIFFEKIIFAVDDERYEKSFNYYNITHDNSGRKVWEYMNTGYVSDSDLEIFRAIANSTETIVRFQGDDYWYDFTVGDADKKAIREVLTTYEKMLMLQE